MALTRGTTDTTRTPKIPIKQRDPITGEWIEDRLDEQRIALVREHRWGAQDEALIERDHLVESNLRMILGDQWSVWSPLVGKFIDLGQGLAPEVAWRELPRLNLLSKWFDLTVARMTENPPILKGMPLDGDWLSNQLADALDVLLPKLWDECQMERKAREIVAWMAGAGWCYLKPRVVEEGDEQPMIGPAVLSMEGADGTMIERVAEAVPYGPQGDPLAQLVESEGDYGYEVTGDPVMQPSGKLDVDVLLPLAARGEWGDAPWQKKRWHIHRSYLSPSDIRDRWGVEVTPDTKGADIAGTQSIFLRLMRGTGYPGVSDARNTGFQAQMVGPDEDGGLVCVDEMWERPCPDYPEGRLLIVTESKVLFDGPRPFPRLAEYGFTSPIIEVPFSKVPGRHFGTTPVERGTPIQRQINQGVRQILKHRAFTTNPIKIYDAEAGLDDDLMDLAQQPGSAIPVMMKPGVTRAPIEYISPPNLSSDVWRTQEWLENAFYKLMDMEGAEGEPATANASGELQKELRFNADRPFSTPIRNMAAALEELGDIWLCQLPTIWTEETLVSYTGEDRIAQTVLIGPELWDGRVRVTINAESMLPMGRGEREARAFRNFTSGVFGDPTTPEAREQFLEQARYPSMDRASGPAGIDRVAAEDLVNRIAMGETSALTEPPREQWNIPVFMEQVRRYMVAPGFRKLDPAIQQEFELYWQALKLGAQMQMVQAGAQAMQAQSAVMSAAPQLPAGEDPGSDQQPPLGATGARDAPRPPLAA